MSSNTSRTREASISSANAVVSPVSSAKLDRGSGLSSGSDRSASSGGARSGAKRAGEEEPNLFEEGTPKSSNDFVERVKNAVTAAVAAVTPKSAVTRQTPSRSVSSIGAVVEDAKVHAPNAGHSDSRYQSEREDHDYELELEDDDAEGKHRAVISPNTLSKESSQNEKLKYKQQQQPGDLQQATTVPFVRPSPSKRTSTFKREPEFESSMTLDVPGLHPEEEEGDDEMEMELEHAHSRGPESVSASESEYSVSAGEEEQELEPAQPP